MTLLRFPMIWDNFTLKNGVELYFRPKVQLSPELVP